ncbi:hypothetical protein [Croceicoccus sp. BE223]|uniref:hypothetical protein n=1 Tax=Croceicoccus sp. BE223 TaxID=2817716 RepID=UPI002863B19C|nr:hypothetical protein [Croceicoccus sp. BE223]MDR7101533.1 hypothetical protein [Croceicoccus sp. BE223]
MIVQSCPFPSGGDLSEFPLVARATTIEGGTIPLLGLDLTDYQSIFVAIDGVRVSVVNTQIGLRVSVDGALRASGYRYLKNAVDSSSTTVGSYYSQGGDRALLSTNVTNAGSHSASWGVLISDNDPSLFKNMIFEEARMISNAPGTATYRGIGCATLEVAGTIDGFHLIPDSTGVITEGSLAVYGVKKSARTAGAVALASMWVGALS